MKYRSDIKLLNVDCLEYMKTVPDDYFDLAIVDPPYGIGASAKNFIRKGKQTGKSMAVSGMKYTVKDWDNCIPKQSYFKELSRVSINQIIWGGNYFSSSLPNSSCWIVWDKDNGTSYLADCELAYTNFNTAVRKYKFRWWGLLQEDMKNKEKRIHPTQKPVALDKWLLQNYAKAGDKILDTHLGSGSIAIACHQMDFELTGCELDAEYYNAAHKRFKEQTAQLRLAV